MQQHKKIRSTRSKSWRRSAASKRKSAASRRRSEASRRTSRRRHTSTIRGGVLDKHAMNLDHAGDWNRIAHANKPVARKVYKQAFLDIFHGVLEQMPSCDISSRIYTRIGSDSMRALVFKFEQRFVPPMAMKVLLYTDIKSEETARKEIELARSASNLVIAKTSPYFPMVFYHTFCSTITLPRFAGNAESLVADARWFSKFNFVINEIPVTRNKKRASVALRVQKTVDPVQISRILATQEIVLPATVLNAAPPIMGNLLFSELFYGDLGAYLEKRPALDLPSLATILHDVLRAICDMQEHLHIAHKDLHLGNVLINPAQPSPNVAIHDFGEAEELSDNNRFDDFLKFFDALLMTRMINDSWSPATRRVASVFNEIKASYIRVEGVAPRIEVVCDAFMQQLLAGDANAENQPDESN